MSVLVALQGGAVAYSLTHVKANITFTGGTHTLSATHALTTVKANVSFTGGTHTLTATRSLTTVKANITFVGGTHTLTWSGAQAPIEQGGSRAVRPLAPALRHYRLGTRAQDIRFVGGVHSLEVDSTARLLDEEEALLLVLV